MAEHRPNAHVRRLTTARAVARVTGTAVLMVDYGCADPFLDPSCAGADRHARGALATRFRNKDLRSPLSSDIGPAGVALHGKHIPWDNSCLFIGRFRLTTSAE